MATVSVSVSDELKKKMNTFPEANWSAIARRSFEQRIKDLERLNAITANVDISDEEIIALGRTINHAIAKRHEKATRKNRR